MPIYEYRNPETGEVIEVLQGMKDFHIYIDYDGLEWHRIWHSPNASVDAKNDGSLEGFMSHTSNKKGTLGDLWDASRESSEKRSKLEGQDMVKKKYFKDYSKKRKEKKHKDDGASFGGLGA